ncbi:hypothetical protein Lser_V15G42727 [Lactuca serriola]
MLKLLEKALIILSSLNTEKIEDGEAQMDSYRLFTVLVVLVFWLVMGVEDDASWGYSEYAQMDSTARLRERRGVRTPHAFALSPHELSQVTSRSCHFLCALLVFSRTNVVQFVANHSFMLMKSAY